MRKGFMPLFYYNKIKYKRKNNLLKTMQSHTLLVALNKDTKFVKTEKTKLLITLLSITKNTINLSF